MDALLKPALEHITKLLQNPAIPELTDDLAAIPELREIHNEIKAVRDILAAVSPNPVRLANQTRELPGPVSGLRSEIQHRADDLEALLERESHFRYLAAHDSLTGAMNRRSFMERALEELKHSFLYGIPCGLIMMDIDHFKKFNDTYGHLAGDEALRHLVRVISDFSRKNDFLGRYGGEEFVFFFCHADREMSVRIAERIREAIQNRPVPLESVSASMTASFGIALTDFTAAGTDAVKMDTYLATLLNNADKAMYRAKDEGRNRVVLFE